MEDILRDSRQPPVHDAGQEAMDVCDNDADSTTTATVNSCSSSSDGSTAMASSFQSYQSTTSSSALLPTAADQAALPITLPVASKTAKSRDWEPSLIQIMRERPDVMQNHNNVRNQAPRGRQKKRPTVELPADDFDDDDDLDGSTQQAHGKKPRAFQSGGETQLQLPGAQQRASFPKILKRDLRRVFGQMYLNVLNSGDPILFARFMRQYVNYNAQYQRYVGNATSAMRLESSSSSGSSSSGGGGGGRSVEESRDIPLIVGRDAIMYFLASHHETAPDTITICQQGSIRQHLNSSESEIVLQVKMAGTRLYMIEWQELMQLIASSQLQQHGTTGASSAASEALPSLPTSTAAAAGAGAGAGAAADDDDAAAAVGNNSLFLEQFRRATQEKLLQTGAASLSSQELSELALLHFTDRMKRVMLTSPAKFEMEGTFTLYLDECFNVYRFDFARHSLQLEAMPELNPYRHAAAAATASGGVGAAAGHSRAVPSAASSTTTPAAALPLPTPDHRYHVVQSFEL
eukprot:gene10112-7209_t